MGARLPGESASDLEALCAERPERTSEKFPPNDFYGHAAVIKHYCGLPQEFSLPGIHPHGPSVNELVWDYEVNHPLPHLLLVAELQRAIYAARTSKPATVIGSPFYYAVRQKAAEMERLSSQASGTIVFPFHSTHHVTATFDEGWFLEKLRALPEEFGPLVICMYWRDVQLGRHRKYLEAGFPCVSAGHMYDHEFLYRLCRLIAARRRCVSNELGTCVFYSAAMGLPVTVFRQKYSLQAADERMLREASGQHTLPGVTRFLEIAAEPSADNVREQKDLAEKALGREALLPSAELRKVLEGLALQQATGMAQAPSPGAPARPMWALRVGKKLLRFKRRWFAE